MITIKKEIDFNSLKRNCKIDNMRLLNDDSLRLLNIVEKYNKQEQLLELINDWFVEINPTISEVNEFLSFYKNAILDKLNIVYIIL